MFGDIWGAIKEFCTFLWPLVIVREWEAGGYYAFGRWRRLCGPGLYIVPPWICDIIPVTVVDTPLASGKVDITLGNGKMLTVDATATVRVVDVFKALNEVDEYKESVQELLRAILGETLALEDPDRLNADRRSRLFASLRQAVHKETMQYGVSVLAVRFTTFVLDAPTVRLLGDGVKVEPW